MIRVTILSPNPALRVGLREMLSGQMDVRVVREGVSLDDLNPSETEVLVLASVSSASLVNVRPDSFGVLILTDDPEDARAVLGLKSRAWGVLPLSASGEEMTAAIRAVGEGLWVGAPGLVQGLMRSSGVRDDSGEESPIESLTAREMEVLQLMAEGLANKQIALRLGISEHTVKFHLSSLYGKLNAAGRTEAVKRGLGLGLVSL